MGYMYPIQHKVFGCLLVEKSEQGMDDRGIMWTFHICDLVFEFLVQTHICRNWEHVPQSVQGFWLFTGWKKIVEKVKSMNGQSIMRTFHVCARVLPKFEI